MQLSPSQRIKLISEVSKRLASEGWPLIDLTLKQFKFGIKETWSGTKEDYLIQLIAYGADDRLISLAQHVGYEFGKPALMGVEPKFWIKGCFKVFISHLSAQQAFAGQLQNELRDFGLSCFVAHKDVEPTTEWQTEIETALATADSMVALLHPDFHKSKWTDQEIGYAMGRDIPIFAVK